MCARAQDVRRASSHQVVDVSFPSEGSGSTPPHEYNSFVFGTHHTQLFTEIRRAHGVAPGAFFTPMMSIVTVPNPGHSGAQFFTTADTAFFFKTVSRTEFGTLARLLPALSQRLAATALEVAVATPTVRRHPGAAAALAWARGRQTEPPAPAARELAPAPEPEPESTLDRQPELGAGASTREDPVSDAGFEEKLWRPLEVTRGSRQWLEAQAEAPAASSNLTDQAPPAATPTALQTALSTAGVADDPSSCIASPAAEPDASTGQYLFPHPKPLKSEPQACTEAGGSSSLLPRFMGLYTVAVPPSPPCQPFTPDHVRLLCICLHLYDFELERECDTVIVVGWLDGRLFRYGPACSRVRRSSV